MLFKENELKISNFLYLETTFQNKITSTKNLRQSPQWYFQPHT